MTLVLLTLPLVLSVQLHTKCHVLEVAFVILTQLQGDLVVQFVALVTVVVLPEEAVELTGAHYGKEQLQLK